MDVANCKKYPRKGCGMAFPGMVGHRVCLLHIFFVEGYAQVNMVITARRCPSGCRSLHSGEAGIRKQPLGSGELFGTGGLQPGGGAC